MYITMLELNLIGFNLDWGYEAHNRIGLVEGYLLLGSPFHLFVYLGEDMALLHSISTEVTCILKLIDRRMSRFTQFIY